MSISRFKQIGYQLLGYKKIPLKDTRKVLNSSNNYKLEKIVKGEEVFTQIKHTILPSGTKIIHQTSKASCRPVSHKTIFDRYGNKIVSYRDHNSNNYNVVLPRQLQQK